MTSFSGASPSFLQLPRKPCCHRVAMASADRQVGDSQDRLCWHKRKSPGSGPHSATREAHCSFKELLRPLVFRTSSAGSYSPVCEEYSMKLKPETSGSRSALLMAAFWPHVAPGHFPHLREFIFEQF